MGIGMEANFERAYWEQADCATKKKLRGIKEFVDYLENVKKEICLASARLSTDESLGVIGPGAEVAVAGIVHAIDYLCVCRGGIQDKDLVLTTRALAALESRR